MRWLADWTVKQSCSPDTTNTGMLILRSVNCSSNFIIPKFPRATTLGDALFIAQYGIPVVLSNPLVGNLHREDEWMDLESMELYYRICERFIIEKLALT